MNKMLISLQMFISSYKLWVFNFYRVRECQILLLFGKTKGCFFPSPYLDDYGETDQGLRYISLLPSHMSHL